MQTYFTNSKFKLLCVFSALFIFSCSHSSKVSIDRKTSSDALAFSNYPEIFIKVRDVLKPDNKLASKIPLETILISSIQKNPSLLDADKDELLKTIQLESATSSDSTKHLRLIPPAGTWGYTNLKFFANHPYFRGKQTIPASNLVEVWRLFIAGAKKQIILNVFDFDLKIIADELIKKAQLGVKVYVGVDKNTIMMRPEVKAVYESLLAGGVQVTGVNPVSLNHQKMLAIDWDDIKQARVLFSSGNLTQSCLGPEGDLISVPAEKRPPESIPNANHVITMRSWLIANLVNHELTKTLMPEFLYRGVNYPTTGSYQVTGPNVDPQTLEAYPENSVVISFAPGGGLRNINKNLIAHFIRNSEGPIRMAQFAYSSNEVSEALLERARKDFQTKNSFDFKSVGDTPFAMQYWSQFLKMSGLEVLGDLNKNKTYVETDANEWNLGLTPQQMSQLRLNVRTAPRIYGNHNFKIDGKSYAVSSKIHHKILATGPYAILGTSFNFSAAAENNNEQILVFKNKELVRFAHGIVLWLTAKSGASVYEEAMIRNRRHQVDVDTPNTVADELIKKDEEQPTPTSEPAN